MSTLAAQRRAQEQWRTKRRREGFSWHCIKSLHEVCTGSRGRLRKWTTVRERPPCTCRCHSPEQTRNDV